MVFNRTNRVFTNTIFTSSSYTIHQIYVSPVKLNFLRYKPNNSPQETEVSNE